MSTPREGSLEAPKRDNIDWQNPEFYDETKLYDEMERVFDVCHGCRRCVSLCQSFPTLFDLVDESDTFEVDGVDKGDYMKVVDQCFMCDLCAETKCPYLPPHEWAIDFPHLMLRAKAFKFEQGDSKWRDRIITSTDRVFGTVAATGMAALGNAANSNPTFRNAMDKVGGIHKDAELPKITNKTARKHLAGSMGARMDVVATDRTRGRLAIFTTCYGNYNYPEIVADLQAVYNHNGIPTRLLEREACCGMPKLELGDLKAVERLKEQNIPQLLAMVDQGYDLTAMVPSCVLMFRQELPLMFPDDDAVQKVAAAFFDPMEYLFLRHRKKLLKTDFRTELGKVAYQVACHQRVQNIGMRTRDVLKLVPGTEVTAIERCSGHDGTYAVKRETYDNAVKIAKPVAKRVDAVDPDAFISDCPLAGNHVARVADADVTAEHPMTLLRRAYDI